MEAKQSNIIFTVDSSIATITINRPEKRNAIDPQLIQDIDKILDKINTDNSIRVVVLRGAGEHFSAGADLNWMQSMKNASEAENHQDSLALAHMLHKLNDLDKPLIGVIKGAAFGGAVGIAACCDIAIAEDQAKFCLSEVKLGLSPAVISPFVISAIGAKNSRRYMLTAEVFDAARALDIGLISSVVSRVELETKLKYFLDLFLQNGPQAVSSTKKLISDIDNSSFSEKSVAEYTAKTIAKIRVSDEAQEGIQSFLDKTKPSWIS